MGIGRTITRNAFWLTAGDATNRLLKLALLAVTTRTIAVADYGAFSFSLTLLAFTFVLADLGVSTVLQRRLSEANDVAYFSTSFTIKLALLVVAIITSLVVSWASYTSVLLLVIILLPMMALDTFKNFFLTVAIANNRMERVALANTIETAVVVVVGFFALARYHTVTALAGAYVLGALVAFLYVLGSLDNRWNWRQLLSAFDLGLAKKIMRASWPLALSGMVWGLMNTTDSLLLGWLTNLNLVAYYNAASKIPQSLGPIGGIIMSATFPSLVTTIQDHQRHEKLFLRIGEIFCAVTIPIAVGGWLVAESLITKVFGVHYAPAYPVLILLLINMIPLIISFFLMQLIVAHNDQLQSLAYVAVAWLANVILGLMLIPRYGMVGAAVSSITGQSIIAISHIIFVRARYHLHFFSWELGKPMVAAVAMAAVLLLVDAPHLSILYSIPLGALVYGATFCLLRPKLLYDVRRIF